MTVSGTTCKYGRCDFSLKKGQCTIPDENPTRMRECRKLRALINE